MRKIASLRAVDMDINLMPTKSPHFFFQIRSQSQPNQSKDKVDATTTENRLERLNSTEESAIIIQKIWRGYTTRKMNKCVADTMQRNRTQQHIE